MPRMLTMLMFAALPLSACAPATTPPPGETVAAPRPPSAATTAPVASAPADATAPTRARPSNAPEPAAGDATIRGAIREGNRPPPALRICAHPVAGGAPTCIDSPVGASEYQIRVAPGRYVVMGWVQGGELRLIAHASQIRCIRAPCPPDELIEVEVAAGEEATGIDLSGGYVDVPSGWPAKP